MTNTLLLSDHRSGSFCCEPLGRNGIKPGELRGENSAGSAPLREPQWIRQNRRAQPGHSRTGVGGGSSRDTGERNVVALPDLRGRGTRRGSWEPQVSLGQRKGWRCLGWAKRGLCTPKSYHFPQTQPHLGVHYMRGLGSRESLGWLWLVAALPGAGCPDHFSPTFALFPFQVHIPGTWS